MRDDFLKQVKEGEHNYQQVYNDIVNDLMVRNIKGNDKCKDLDAYDSESKMPSLLIPGNIYIFTYKADNPTVYQVPGEKPVEFYDSVPLVLITSNTQKSVRGINLNLCNYGLKTLVLNTFYNIDPNFFDSEASILYSKNKPVLSNKILMFL